MFKKLGRLAFEGLATVLPLAVTLYALWWAGSTAERWFRPPIEAAVNYALPVDEPVEEGAEKETNYVPGMGFVAGIVILVAVGITARLWIAQKLLSVGDNLLKRIPLAKTVYGSVKDLLSVFSGKKKSFTNVAFLKIPGTAMKVLGMVTRDDFSDFPEVPEGYVSIYLPMSYQIGGFTFLVPTDCLETVDMTVEDALRFAMTAAVSSEEREPAAGEIAAGAAANEKIEAGGPEVEDVGG
ncbi:MAG: DUF502 domain-containing protein [Planctomycetota bacterium]|jgi:uncharacterized membrane protein